jgi:pimeloyl-ACP methyl ester carboxylesterase
VSGAEAKAEVDGRIIRTALGPIEVAELGSAVAPAVMLLHGTPGSWRQAVPLAEDLASANRVLLPSRPGYGRTPISGGRTPEEQAALLCSLLDALAIEKATVVGISGGGPAALAFAQQHPDRTNALALLCAVAAHLVNLGWQARPLVAIAPLAAALTWRSEQKRRQLVGNADAIEAFIKEELNPTEFKLAADDPRIHADLVRFLHSHADAPLGVAGRRNDARQMMLAARRGPQRVDRIDAPTLVMHGDADTVVPITHAEHHAAVIPQSELLRIPDAGHMFLVTHREETLARLRVLSG